MTEPKKSRRTFADRAKHLRKRERTRAKLLDAAVTIFARDGFDATSANEIARAADVAHGTFYLHFKDKEELGQAVALEIGREVAAQLDAALEGVDDAVERSGYATRQFIEYAASHPNLGWALYRASWSHRDLRQRINDYLRADLDRGVRQGAFKAELDDLLVGAIVAMIATGMYSRLAEEAGPEAGSRIAELQLLMLGVDPDRAQEVAWRELPPFEGDIELG